MFSILFICAMSLFNPIVAHENDDVAVATVVESTISANNESNQVNEAPVLNERFWRKRKSLRFGYEMNVLQNANGSVYPEVFGVGFSNVRNFWLHKKTIANCLKFAFDMGFDINYTFLDLADDDSYTGPSGYVGTEPLPDGDGEALVDLTSIGSHYFSVGWALGVSVTVNPVAKLRVAGYAHFVPSAAMHFSGLSANVGFMPYLKYGCELSYGAVGLGAEWGTAKGKCTDLISSFMSESENSVAPKSLLYSNYTKLYIVFRFGR